MEDECPVRIKLSDAIAESIRRLYLATKKHEKALNERKNADPFLQEMNEARKDERVAVAALNAHRKEHRC
jgi:uncharacterized protein involved in exopolysaccharide biosynthesis